MTPAEYRALNRSAWLLRDRGRLHVGRLDGYDYRGQAAQRLVVWTCRNCSTVAKGEHIPAVPCLTCKTPTVRRDRYRSDLAICLRCDVASRARLRAAA
jgi:hypothetical protein